MCVFLFLLMLPESDGAEPTVRGFDLRAREEIRAAVVSLEMQVPLPRCTEAYVTHRNCVYLGQTETCCFGYTDLFSYSA